MLASPFPRFSSQKMSFVTRLCFLSFSLFLASRSVFRSRPLVFILNCFFSSRAPQTRIVPTSISLSRTSQRMRPCLLSSRPLFPWKLSSPHTWTLSGHCLNPDGSRLATSTTGSGAHSAALSGPLIQKLKTGGTKRSRSQTLIRYVKPADPPCRHH